MIQFGWIWTIWIIWMIWRPHFGTTWNLRKPEEFMIVSPTVVKNPCKPKTNMATTG